MPRQRQPLMQSGGLLYLREGAALLGWDLSPHGRPADLETSHWESSRSKQSYPISGRPIANF